MGLSLESISRSQVDFFNNNVINGTFKTSGNCPYCRLRILVITGSWITATDNQSDWSQSNHSWWMLSSDHDL